jgi:hypothetical protein
VIDIICLRRRIRNLHHVEVRVCGNKAVQAFLQLDRQLRRIVGNVDAGYVGGIDNSLNYILDAIYDNTFLVRQIGYNRGFS